MAARLSESNLDTISDLEVWMHGRLVGRLAQASKRAPIVFEYAPDWLANGYSISPFSLPLEPGVKVPLTSAPGALFGVFEDSLPDDWGRTLVNRMLAKEGIDPAKVTTLGRLAIVGDMGLGALEYRPVARVDGEESALDFDHAFVQALAIMNDETPELLDALFRQGGSSGGARPKLMLEIDGDPWIVKFPMSSDDLDAGLNEHRFAKAAVACGIAMPYVKLLPSKVCPGYFAVRRFDRIGGKDEPIAKVHMASAAALLEANPFDDTLDYADLMKLTVALTGNVSDCGQLFRIMCFNVFAGNCDDHMRNFSYLCDGAGNWRLSPAYDLTPNPGLFGEHAVLVNGKGSEIGESDLLRVGAEGNISPRKARAILKEISDVVSSELGGQGA